MQSYYKSVIFSQNENFDSKIHLVHFMHNILSKPHRLMNNFDWKTLLFREYISETLPARESKAWDRSSPSKTETCLKCSVFSEPLKDLSLKEVTTLALSRV